MITIFTHVRPFENEFDAIQRTAIASWQTQGVDTQVVLFGDDLDSRLIAKGLGINWLPSKVTPMNYPSFAHLFIDIETHYPSDWYLEVSSDIVLSGLNIALPILESWAHLFTRPLVIGQRIDVEVGPHSRVIPQYHPPSAVDYFLYKKGTLGDIPLFNIGRTVYDNWLVWAARDLWNMQVVNATEAITAYHLNHTHPEHGNKARMLDSAARQYNLDLARATGANAWLGVDNANYTLP